MRYLYAVVGSFFSDGLEISNFVIERVNHCFHNWHAAIAYLSNISVKYLVELVVRWDIDSMLK